jgi:predicted NACHT family NTPase
MLRRLALEMQSAPGGLKGNIIAGDKLEAIFRDYFKQELEHPDPRNAAREMVRQLRERNYILCQLGQDNFAFVHRTFLEYFCASALVRQSLREASSLEFLKTQVFAPHWRDESWHEVLRLIAGMDDQLPVEHVAKIIDFLLKRKGEKHRFHNIFLAANCCLEVRNPHALSATRTRVTNVLMRLIQTIRSKVSYETDDETDDTTQKYIEQMIEETDRSLVKKSIRFLANEQLFDTAKEWLEGQVLKNNDWMVRQIAVQELAVRWKDDPATLPLLKERAAQDEKGYVRKAALQELVRGWKDDPATLPWLKERAAQDEEGYVRSAALQELVRGWKDDPSTLPLLRERAENDPTPWLREQASRLADEIEARG